MIKNKYYCSKKNNNMSSTSSTISTVYQTELYAINIDSGMVVQCKDKHFKESLTFEKYNDTDIVDCIKNNFNYIFENFEQCIPIILSISTNINIIDILLNEYFSLDAPIWNSVLTMDPLYNYPINIKSFKKLENSISLKSVQAKLISRYYSSETLVRIIQQLSDTFNSRIKYIIDSTEKTQLVNRTLHVIQQLDSSEPTEYVELVTSNLSSDYIAGDVWDVSEELPASIPEGILTLSEFLDFEIKFYSKTVAPVSMLVGEKTDMLDLENNDKTTTAKLLSTVTLTTPTAALLSELGSNDKIIFEEPSNKQLSRKYMHYTQIKKILISEGYNEDSTQKSSKSFIEKLLKSKTIVKKLEGLDAEDEVSTSNLDNTYNFNYIEYYEEGCNASLTRTRVLHADTLAVVSETTEPITDFIKSQNPKNLNKLAKYLFELMDLMDDYRKEYALTKKEYLKRLEDNHRKTIAENDTDSKKTVLYDWQKNMVSHMHSGESVFVNTPTSGGKTFVCKYAFSKKALMSKERYTNAYSEHAVDVVYVGPTFHLALQFYSDIIKKFADVSFVTGICNYIVPNSRFYVGTPNELLTYFESRNTVYGMGIFDEIHTISLDTEYMKEHTRAWSINKLFERCKKQVIALSATINSEDVEGLQLHVLRACKLNNIHRMYRIIQSVRHINVLSMHYTGESIEPITRTTQLTTEVPVTACNTYNFFTKLKTGGYLPAFLFEESEDACYNNFVNYVNYIEMHSEIYGAPWNALHSSFHDEIIAFGDACQAFSHLVETEKDKKIGVLIRDRNNLVSRIQLKIEQAIEYCKFSPEYPRDLYVDANGVPNLVHSLQSQLNNLLKSNRDQAGKQGNSVESIPLACEGVPEFFTVYQPEDNKNELLNLSNVLSEVFVKKTTKNKSNVLLRRVREELYVLCACEKIRLKENKDLFKLLSKALKYGISIILPTIPFVIQYQIFKLLKNTKSGLKLVFISKSMAIGVNYPVKTVVCRYSKLTEVNISEYLQTTGRAGRKGFDMGGAYSIAWNINNVVNISLPRLKLISTSYNIVNSYSKDYYNKIIRLESFSKEFLKVGDMHVLLDHIDHKKSMLSRLVIEGLNKRILECIEKLMNILFDNNMFVEDSSAIILRIYNLLIGVIPSHYSENAYSHSTKISDYKNILQELYIKIYYREMPMLLWFITVLHRMLQIAQYRQMRLVKVGVLDEIEAEDSDEDQEC